MTQSPCADLSSGLPNRGWPQPRSSRVVPPVPTGKASRKTHTGKKNTTPPSLFAHGFFAHNRKRPLIPQPIWSDNLVAVRPTQFSVAKSDYDHTVIDFIQVRKTKTGVEVYAGSLLNTLIWARHLDHVFRDMPEAHLGPNDWAGLIVKQERMPLSAWVELEYPGLSIQTDGTDSWAHTKTIKVSNDQLTDSVQDLVQIIHDRMPNLAKFRRDQTGENGSKRKAEFWTRQADSAAAFVSEEARLNAWPSKEIAPRPMEG
jgi:hypothetical protein